MPTKAELEKRIKELEAEVVAATESVERLQAEAAERDAAAGVSVTPGVPIAGNANGRCAEHRGQEYPTRLVTIQVAVADVPAEGYEARQIRTRGNLQTQLDGKQFRALRATTFGLALPELRSGRKLGTNAEATRQVFQAIHDAAWPNGYPDEPEPEPTNVADEPGGPGRPIDVDGVRIVPCPGGGWCLEDTNADGEGSVVFLGEAMEPRTAPRLVDAWPNVESAHNARREYLAAGQA